MSKQLTTIEKSVLELVAKGFNNRKISEEMNISISTVKSHLEDIFAKLGVKNRVMAAVYAVENDLIQPLHLS